MNVTDDPIGSAPHLRARRNRWMHRALVAEAEAARLRAILADLVWVTNILGTEICDYCGVPRAESAGKPGCSCEPLRAPAGDGGPGADRGAAGWDEVAGVALDPPSADRG